MGCNTYLMFCLSAKAETELQTELPDAISRFSEEDSTSLIRLINKPTRLVRKDGWLLRIWPAEKWDTDERPFNALIEDFVIDHEVDALLVKHGESHVDGHDQCGVGEGNPFQITVDYPVGDDDPYFSYDDETGQRKNTKHIVWEQVALLQNDTHGNATSTSE